MSNQNINAPKPYQHHSGKYSVLDDKNQTPKKFVIGQKYKVGTGIALVRNASDDIDRLLICECGYKEFLSKVLIGGLFGELLALKWVPKRKAQVDTIASHQCGGSCVSTCVKPGCVCVDTQCQ